MSKYKFGSHLFNTKAEAKKHWSKWIVDHHNQKISVGHDDWQACVDLLHNHPNHKTAQPEWFAVMSNQMGNPEMRFYVGGNFHIFSISSAVTGNSKSLEARMITAMREAVKRQVEYARLSGMDIKSPCGWCGQPIGGEVHVDHVIPFKSIAEGFLLSWGGRMPDEVGQDLKRGGPYYFLPSDAQFEAAWIEYHLDKAELRLLHPSCNLERGRSDKLKKSDS